MSDLNVLKIRYANKKAVVICDAASFNSILELNIECKEVVVFTSKEQLTMAISKYAYDDSVYIVKLDSIPILSTDKIFLETETFSVSELKTHLATLPKTSCQMRQLHIDEKGTVYPCYKLLGSPYFIGDISDKDIIKKIYDYNLPNGCFCNKSIFNCADKCDYTQSLRRIYLEMGGYCQAKCLYCFQQTHENFRLSYKRYEELLNFCRSLPHKEMVIGGGEVLVQNKTLDFIRQYRAAVNSDIRINTNGSVPTSMLDTIEELFDIVNITFNGFTSGTTKALMDVDLKYAKKIAEILSRNKKVRLGLKFLASPLCIADLPSFLEWAIKLSPYRINIKIAEICHLNKQNENMWNGSSFSKLNLGYWQPIFSRVGTAIEKIINKNAAKLKLEKIRLSLQEGLIDLLNLSEDTLGSAEITFVC